ncbi:MAG: excinuclease ABC subunit UvrA [bacterium]
MILTFETVVNFIKIRGARVHNLKNIDVDIPKDKLVVITGLSGSGKSSLAFDTLYAEGQRRYMESLSSYARRFLELQDKPDVDLIEGLSPTIAIDQRSTATNPRSTVGTMTEIYDYLRLLFARVGVPHCPKCGREVELKTTEEIRDEISEALFARSGTLLVPLAIDEKGDLSHFISAALEAGFREARFDSELMELNDAKNLKRDKNRRHSLEVVVAHLAAKPDPARLLEIVRQALETGRGSLVLAIDGEGPLQELMFAKSLSCPVCRLNLPTPEPRLFSFNSPHGACPDCTGLGIKLKIDSELVIPNRKLTIMEGAIKPWTRIAGAQNGHFKILETVAQELGLSLSKPVKDFSKHELDQLFYGTGAREYLVDGVKRNFPGLLADLEEKHRVTESDYVRTELESYMREERCSSCVGKRLRPEVLSITIGGKNVSEVTALSLADLLAWCQTLTKDKHRSKTEILVTEKVVKEIRGRLQNVLEVGLDYLALDRSVTTLAGGESQRLRLATQLGTSLSGVVYVLDEPSIGLHPRDHEKLIVALRKLRDLGNTVVVVEHDAAMMTSADYLIDVGPGAGVYGGEIMAVGTPDQVKKNKESLTGKYLSGKIKIEVPEKFRKPSSRKLTITGASAFNLKDITVEIPLGLLVCVTGVSGSGKSTLVLDILGNALAQHFYRAKSLPAAHEKITGLENLDKVVTVDQSPIGRTPRSNPATYTGLFTAIRDLFTEVPEAKARGFDAGKFSFNVKGGGRCESCAGEGLKRIEMQLMPDVYVECEECHGARYNHEALEVRYKAKTIADILSMTVEEARRFFSDKPSIYEKLNVLHEVGLGYLELGQSATTLSGGEAQRVKLATELSRRATGRTLYILDEPTTGLHFDDIKRLLLVLQRLVDKGNSILVIEHNLDIIKSADWIIDLGPDGGDKGGELVATGTPRDIIKVKRSLTGKYLKEVM